LGFALLVAALIANGESAFAGPLSALTPRAATPLTSAAPAASSAAPPEKIAPDSPRAAMSDFTKLTRAGDYGKAARYLDLTAVDQSDGPVLAKHLREVLDRHLWIDVDKLSPESHGDTEDGQAPDREELGNVTGAAGKPVPVLLVRKVDARGARWVFSAATVGHIDEWYEHLENRWLLDHLPKMLLGFGPRELRWWQWLALAPLLILGWLLGFAITRLSGVVIHRVMSAHGAETMRRMRGPATLAWMIVACYALLPWLGLYEPADAFVRRGFSAALLIAFFWALWRAVELSQHAVSSAQWAKNSLTAHSLLLLAARLGKFAVAAFASVAVLAELGYSVTSIITGLGIGGIALALAAQKTVENLFGAFSLAVDRPFREGDFIQVDNVSGTVEVIGLRSTRIRTVDRTLITIPNGKLADMRIETVSARDRIRFYALIGVVHSASARVGEIISGIEALLRDNEVITKSSISVRLIAITDSALNLELSAICELTDYDRFMSVRQALLLGVIEVVEQFGAALAHPTRNIELDPDFTRQILEKRG
jgi:MscS family membrane protein